MERLWTTVSGLGLGDTGSCSVPWPRSRNNYALESLNGHTMLGRRELKRKFRIRLPSASILGPETRRKEFFNSHACSQQQFACAVRGACKIVARLLTCWHLLFSYMRWQCFLTSKLRPNTR